MIKVEPLISAAIPNLKIVIAGRGENLDQYKEKIKNKANFKFYNHFIGVKEVSKFFQKASIIILPYKEATQSGLIPLAYSFSKSVVATSVGGLQEQMQDGIQGFLTPYGNEKLFASKIIQLLKDDELRAKLGNNSRKYYDTVLSGSEISSSIIKTYKKTLQLIKKK